MYRNSKDIIISTALELFNANGIEEVEISQVEKRTGLSSGKMKDYFPSKIALLEGIYNQYLHLKTSALYELVKNDQIWPSDVVQLLNEVMRIQYRYRCFFLNFSYLFKIPGIHHQEGFQDRIWRGEFDQIVKGWRKSELLNDMVHDHEEDLLFNGIKFLIRYRFLDSRFMSSNFSLAENELTCDIQIASLLKPFLNNAGLDRLYSSHDLSA